MLLSWSLNESDLSQQYIVISGDGRIWNVSVDGNATAVNVTGLQPNGVKYLLKVIAVAVNGQLSIPSVSVMGRTQFICKK